MTSKNTLSMEIINSYHTNDYYGAAEKTKILLHYCECPEEQFQISVDLAHLLCLAEKYEEATPILKRLIKEVGIHPEISDEVMEKIYLAYASCMLHSNDYIRFYYFINKYLKIAQKSNPDAYSAVKQIVSHD